MEKYIIKQSNNVAKEKLIDVWKNYTYVVKWDGKCDILKCTIDRDRFLKTLESIKCNIDKIRDDSEYDFDELNFSSVLEFSHLRYQTMMRNIISKIREDLRFEYYKTEISNNICEDFIKTRNINSDSCMNRISHRYKFILINDNYMTDEIQDFIGSRTFLIISSVLDVLNINKIYEVVILRNYVSLIRSIFHSNYHLLVKLKHIILNCKYVIAFESKYHKYTREYLYLEHLCKNRETLEIDIDMNKHISYTILEDMESVDKIIKHYILLNEHTLIVSDNTNLLDNVIDNHDSSNVKIARYRDLVKLYDKLYTCENIIAIIDDDINMSTDHIIHFISSISKSKIYIKMKCDELSYYDQSDEIKEYLEYCISNGKLNRRNNTIIKSDQFYNIDEDFKIKLIQCEETEYLMNLENYKYRMKRDYVRNLLDKYNINHKLIENEIVETDINIDFIPNEYNYQYGIYTDLIIKIKNAKSKRNIMSILSRYDFLASEFMEGSKFKNTDINIKSMSVDDIKSLIIIYIEFYNICTYTSQSHLSCMSKVIMRMIDVLDFNKCIKLDSYISYILFGKFSIPDNIEDFNRVINSYNKANRRIESGKEEIKECGGKLRDYRPIKIIEDNFIKEWTSLIKLERIRSGGKTKYIFVLNESLSKYVEHLYQMYG